MTDAFLFTYNVCVLFLLFVLKERLDTIKLSAKDNPDDNRTYRGGKKEVRNIEAEIDHEQAHQLITRLRNLMEIDKLYKDPDIEISKIGLELGVSYSYLSKVIRLKGFNNFNHYINTYRINYVKKLLQESDLEKMTLMYIYSEAGFKNQSTFNRAFKQIEGVTPSEYIKSRFK
ncbi:AraC family transcriptional regulator [Chryseobacterium sp.]|uniref:helix-turn-helix domain-containing protein n=1 Tax=Chryseobacterium sp. TaxID=1871047 RepID=UPI001B19E69E|nr:AraC family transcriptional regulator [Chryseobacterium sp.]MBO9692931.1 helix-turn-helix transcriptional regulator [Chryseobacterium sp.]